MGHGKGLDNSINKKIVLTFLGIFENEVESFNNSTTLAGRFSNVNRKVTLLRNSRQSNAGSSGGGGGGGGGGCECRWWC
ncbi:hypothetical protein M0804_008671 [Polistes exclamans]|nr:hypothetical protein M0804_008671 [Polistes exclamans]